MSVLAFDPYSEGADLLAAKVANPAKMAEIRHFSEAKQRGGAAKQAKPGANPLAGQLASLADQLNGLAPGNPQKTSCLAGLAGLAVSGPSILKSTPCTRCGAASAPMIEVVNPEGWLCAECWPGDPNDAAHDATERAAIVAEGEHGNPAAVVHDMPVSWADASIAPTPGARCRCCRGASWWGDRLGWRCTACHPPLGAGPVLEVRT